MMFRKVNKQPEKQKFWNWCSHYQEIYIWLNITTEKTSWQRIYSLYGGNEYMYGESGHLCIFTLLKHLMMLLKYSFFRASFLHTLPKWKIVKQHL